ncbi:MAG TPA: hypothetical protein VH165_27225 [Kofleriaceae bacterium]|nr:hypothetical protein [Kofleriaceae bacterium]
MEPQVLIVTSAGAPSAAVVPVLAAIEAAGMRVRAIDVGAAGGGGVGVADRVRRALLGEGAERRLRRELEVSPPDAAVVFDPYAALALTVARDQVQNPAPVIAVVGDLDPAAAWAETDADRFVAIDELAAVALADTGVEGERILIVGAIGERAFADAGAEDRAGLRGRFKLSGKVALVEVAGLGPELTGQLAMQLSLLDGGDAITWLFDAAGDVDAAAVLRRQVPSLGLRAKLFGATPDAPLLWRAADIIVARPRHEVVARVLLVGGKLVALVDDNIAGSARAAAALETRKRAVAAKGLLLLSAALDSAFGGAPPAPTHDGGDNIADVVAAVANDKRGVIDERRAAAHAATRDRVRAASAAATAAAQSAAVAGDLEDLGDAPPAPADVPDAAELSRLRTEVQRRVIEMTRSMNAARDMAQKLGDDARAARARDPGDAGGEAEKLERRADVERAKMHAMLAELATLDSELKELERAGKAAADAARTNAAAQASTARAASGAGSTAGSADGFGGVGARGSLDDQLSELKRRAGPGSPGSSGGGSSGGGSSAGASGAGPRPAAKPGPRKSTTVEDDLAALKQKMAAAPPKKKP